MFEEYSEKTKRVLFFARHEALEMGAECVESEHLLLALLNEDKELAQRFLKSNASIGVIRQQVEAHAPVMCRRAASTVSDVPLHSDCKRALAFAEEEARPFPRKRVAPGHLLLGLLREENCLAAQLLRQHGISAKDVRAHISRTAQQQAPPSRVSRESSLLAEFSRDLTRAANDGHLDPLIGRGAELERVIQILCRRMKNNPVLIGEPGVGKTAIVEGLAQRIARSEVPSFLAEKRLLSLDLSLVVAGTKYRGQFEERLKGILKELAESGDCIVFIDELHTLVGAGSAEGSMDAANILKPALARGEIQCIGATTPAEYRKYIEKDRSLERRFQAVKVTPPTEAEAVAILNGLREQYEKFHGVSYSTAVVRHAVYHSNRYVPDRFLPDKAIDLLDEAGAKVKLRECVVPEEVVESQKKLKFLIDRMEYTVLNHEFDKARFYSGEERQERENLQMLREKYQLDARKPVQVELGDVEEVISRWTGVPLTAIREEESQKLLRMEKELHQRVISQEKAISCLARSIRRSRAGLKSPQRPIGSFLFLGPTGVGKTEVARTLAEFLFGSEKALVRFDMSEFMEKYSVSKLIGSPPGYMGYDEGGQLTEKVRRSPYCIILLDEIEKAHPDVFNVLLQVLEDGRLTDGLGNTVDFKNTLIVMTSNIGARHLMKEAPLGFHSDNEKLMAAGREDMVKAELKKTFSPEFINRLDEIVVFNMLSEKDLIRIIDLLVQQLNANLAEQDIRIAMTDQAKSWLLQQTAPDRNYGARPLRRALQRYVEDPLSEALIGGSFSARPLSVEIYLEENELQYRQTEIGMKLATTDQEVVAAD
ncbi:MAG TPA: ATP-dependent Clp protease ATP-binding subunit [Candidatus Angelobacter sp.]|nr:ATP-dependent Clp protease ATP-binding subunit [Candidatus Angelobacter sp.]